MSTPPNIPTQRRFLLPKRAPKQGTPQSTPRFGPPSSAPRPSQFRRDVEDVDDDDDEERVEASSIEEEEGEDDGRRRGVRRDRDVIGDSIEVASESSRDDVSVFQDYRGGSQHEEPMGADLGDDAGPSPGYDSPEQRDVKRRKLSITPLSAFSPPTKAHISDIGHTEEPDRTGGSDPQCEGSLGTGHGDYPSDLEAKNKTPQQPTFQPAPRFKPLGSEHLAEGLPEAFSPQRRGAKYLPGGLAAGLQGWLSEMKGKEELVGFSFQVAVEDVRPGRRMYLVRGEYNAEEGPRRLILAGEGRLTGLGRRALVGVGSVVEVRQPVWDVEVDGETWTVACDWNVP